MELEDDFDMQDVNDDGESADNEDDFYSCGDFHASLYSDNGDAVDFEFINNDSDDFDDTALYRHQGVMLDTSKNYYPVEDILRTIAAMSMNKLNVFHWHITDSHSFSLVVPSEPSLAENGSYGSNMQYSPADVSRIVEYGLDHGVRVLPEIDTPACLECLEAVPWVGEEEKEKVVSTVLQLQGEGIGVNLVLKRVSSDISNAPKDTF